MVKPVMVIGAAAAPGEPSPWQTGARVDRWNVLVDNLLEDFEDVLIEVRDGNVIHFDMDVFPERGDALDHFDKASVVIADHLFYDDSGMKAFFYNRRNNQIIDIADRAGVPLILIGDYPMSARRPDAKDRDWRLYRPKRAQPNFDQRHIRIRPKA